MSIISPRTTLLAATIIFVHAASPAPMPAAAAIGQIRADLAPTAASTAQYQNVRNAVSPGAFPAVSRWIGAGIRYGIWPRDVLNLQRDRSVESFLGLRAQVDAAQYQPDSGDRERRLMLRIGAGLGVAYVVFLAGWIWATRLRSRPRRH